MILTIQSMTENYRASSLDLVEEGEELFHEHEYHRNLDYRQDPVYTEYFNSYKEKYEMNL